MSSPVIDLREVCVKYHTGAPVLSAVSAQVSAGEFVAVLGVSGGGKSTLLRTIAGLVRPNSGTLNVAVEGTKVGFIFQEPTLLPWLNARDNVALALKLLPAAQTEARDAAEQALSLVGLARRADAYPRELSGGEKMRVSIARAIVRKPGVLLLDEPFAALDELTRERLNEELLTLHCSEGWTSVFVTHSVSEAVFLATRVLVLHGGSIAAEVDVSLRHPRTAETRRSSAYRDLVAGLLARLTRLERPTP